ncbi:MAG: ribosomal-processing cysteine protease Prp [Ruminococcus sp.]|jgi:hypothetical protein|nr:ribosomal-processing cysteine protease Prp [Ruminococcus sp.]MBR6394020.1 ribosomal-processing cysteine protease Prp [Ruminococcus sp.]MCR5730908.1 ribosomal-processing cysteine protease Prp [Ruminococcus sp.]
MIRADFYESKGVLKGFSFSGHSGYAESGSDIVCASVSSAVQFTVNLLEEFGCSPDVKVEENLIKCTVKSDDNSSRILNQLRLHFGSILEEFPGTIKITISEV